MRESQVEAHLVKRVEETGGLIRKIAYIGRRSCPDRLVGWPQHGAFIVGGAECGSITPARNALVETKKPETPKAQAAQAREHERLRSIGFDVRVLDTIEAVDAFIEERTR
jgi:hypothetical protein